MQVGSTLEGFVQVNYRQICVGIVFLFVLSGMTGCGVLGKKKAADKPPVDPELKQLAERAETAIDNVGTTPGREYANRLRGKRMQKWLKYFKGEGEKPNWPKQEKAIEDVTRLVERVEAGDTWPEPGRYEIPFTKTAPEIDGQLDDAAWDTAKTFTEIYPFNSTEEGGPATTFKVMWDKQNLYFAFDCEDKDVVAKDRERDGHVYFDDCVEMFILPDLRYRVYWELVIGPNGSIFDAVNTKKPHKWGCTGDPEKDIEGLKTAQQIRGTLNDSSDVDEGYSVEVAVPFSDLPSFTRYPPRPGDTIKCMLIRLDRNGEEFKTYAFRPLQAWGHNLWNHAVFELKR